MKKAMGMVYLVGAGPGDPDLITKRGADLLARADCLVYDYLANPELLALVPEGAEKIYVGKKGGDHTKSQWQINDLLREKASVHNTVVRLKGGDPFVFGRGGEEAEELVRDGIRVEVAATKAALGAQLQSSANMVIELDQVLNTFEDLYADEHDDYRYHEEDHFENARIISKPPTHRDPDYNN